jgi:hypothetical protein
MSQQEFSWRRVFAMPCGIFSLLFAGQIGLVAALDHPRGSPMTGFACVGALTLFPLLLSCAFSAIPTFGRVIKRKKRNFKARVSGLLW